MPAEANLAEILLRVVRDDCRRLSEHRICHRVEHRSDDCANLLRCLFQKHGPEQQRELSSTLLNESAPLVVDRL